MDLLQQEKKEQVLKDNPVEPEFVIRHQHYFEEQGFDREEDAEAVKEKEAELYAALNETCETFIPKEGTKEPVPPVRYQTPSKGKKGRNKRIEDEKRLEAMRKEQDIASVVNHRGMRVVEKFRGTYNTDNEIKEQSAPKVKDAVASMLKLVPSQAMAEEKYLADHAEDVKRMFRESLYLEEAMQVPEYKDYFEKMDPIERQLLNANLDAMKGLRQIMKAKLLTMGVVLNDEDYENITADYLSEENATPEQMEKANESLSDARAAYIANNYRLRIRSTRLKKELDAKKEGRELRLDEKIAGRTEDPRLLDEMKDRIKGEVEARFKAKGRSISHTRSTMATAALYATYTNMSFKEAVDFAEALQFGFVLEEEVREKEQTRKDDPNYIPNKRLSARERIRFARAMEKVFSLLNSYDKDLSNKLYGGEGILTCSQEEFEKIHFPQYVAMDLDPLVKQYGILLSKHPDECALDDEQFFDAYLQKDVVQNINGTTNNIDLLYSQKLFTDKNVKIEDIKSKVDEAEMYAFGEKLFKDIPSAVQIKQKIDIGKVIYIAGSYTHSKIDDFDEAKNITREKTQKSYDRDYVNLKKQRIEDPSYKKTQEYRVRAINTLKEKEKEAKEQEREYTRREHLDNIVKSDTERRAAYRNEVVEAVKKKLGISEVDGDWRYALSTAANYGMATGESFDRVVDIAIALNIGGSNFAKATEEDKKKFVEAMDLVLDQLDKTDLTLLSKGGTEAQFELSDEDHLKLREATQLAMDMDPLMGHYEDVLFEKPELCGRTEEEYLKSRPIRDMLTGMNQQIVVIDQLYASEYIEQNIPFEKLYTMTSDDVDAEMKKMQKAVDQKDLQHLSGLYGSMAYFVMSIEAGQTVVGDFNESLERCRKHSIEMYEKHKKEAEKKAKGE